MGLETARLARAHGADVVLTGRDPDRLRDAAQQVDARTTAAFDVTDLARVEQFFADAARTHRPRHGHRRRPLLLAAGGHGLRRGPARHRRSHPGDARRRPLRRRPDAAARHPAVHRRHRRPPGRRRLHPHLGDDRRPPAAGREPGARAGADPGEPHRRRLRRHAPVGVAPRRPARGPPRRAPRHAPHRPRRRTGRRRRAGGPPHDQHRAHRRDVRHRRRPAAAVQPRRDPITTMPARPGDTVPG